MIVVVVYIIVADADVDFAAVVVIVDVVVVFVVGWQQNYVVKLNILRRNKLSFKTAADFKLFYYFKI